MDDRMVKALEESKLFLLEKIEFDNLQDRLDEIFPRLTIPYIKAGGDNPEKVRRMLDELIRRSENDFFRFLNALRESSQAHCAEEIERNYVRSGPTQVSDLTPGPVHTVTSSYTSVPVQSSNLTQSSYCLQLPSELQGVEMQAGGRSVSSGFPDTSGSMSSSFLTQFRTPIQESTSCSSGELMTGREQSENGDDPMCVDHATGPANPTAQGSVYLQQLTLRPENVYRMESTPRGLALVINNETFDTMKPRPGSVVDMNRLHDLFKMLGFLVSHEKDKTAQEMRKLLKGFASLRELRNVHSLIVVILSHGGKHGVIFGKDGRTDGKGNAAKNTYVTDDDVRDFFKARLCPQMAGKPKLFIIQACRGKNEDLLVKPSVSPSSGSDGAMHTEGSSMVSSSTSSGSHRTADMADFCLIHSSASGYVAYRDPKEGSPFITTLTNIFKRDAAKEHILDIMTEVTGELSSRSFTSDDRKTVPSTTQMLTKRWYLNPPSQPFSPSVQNQMKY